MAVIAREEAEHLQLAIDLHQWFISKLSTQDQEKVNAAKREALTKLHRYWHCREPSDLDRELGLPAPERGQKLSTAFAAA